MTHQPNDWEDKQLDQWLEDTYGHRHIQWQQVLVSVATVVCWLVGATGLLLLGYAAWLMVQAIL